MNRMLSQITGVTTKAKPSAQQSCLRCSGYMTHELCTDLDSDSGYSTFWAMRCVQCGNIVDAAILRNRSLPNSEILCDAAASSTNGRHRALAA